MKRVFIGRRDFCLHGTELAVSGDAGPPGLGGLPSGEPEWLSAAEVPDLLAAENYNAGPEETRLCVFIPVQCKAFFKDAREAYHLTEWLFAGDRSKSDNTKANAFQHAFWTGLMLRDVPHHPRLALAEAAAHENFAYKTRHNTPTRRASRMDILNDEVGFQFARTHLSHNAEYLCRGMMNAVHAGTYIGPAGEPYEWWGYNRLVWRYIHDRAGVKVRFNGRNCAPA